jgi:hypothetical protein
MRSVLGGLVLGAVFACGGEAGTPVVAASAGTPGAGVGGTGGAEPTGPGPLGALEIPTDDEPPDTTLGELLPLVVAPGPVPYAIGDNPYSIRGAAFLLRSELGNEVTIAERPGELCISGTVEDIEDLDYARYWGIELGFDLAVSSGSSPAGAPAEPWRPGPVVGLSYVIEGPTLSPIRFKALPAGYDPELDTSVFCKDLQIQSGVVELSAFSEVTRACWEGGDTPVPLADGLVRVSWQIPATIEPIDRRFDWCLKELRPILAP